MAAQHRKERMEEIGEAMRVVMRWAAQCRLQGEKTRDKQPDNIAEVCQCLLELGIAEQERLRFQ